MSGRSRSTRRRRADLSQHFLLDDSAARLVRETSIGGSDLVVEIGAGRGALTRPVSDRAGRVIAVEIDPFLVAKLRRDFRGRAEIVAADFLEYELPRGEYSLIGNIPYALSTDIVRKVTSASNPPTDAWLVVQREFAERLCGQPFAKESLWSLKLKPLWHLEIIDRVPSREFSPPPSVESAFLHLRWRERPIVRGEEIAGYHRLLEAGFKQQPLGRSLKPLLSKVQLRRVASDYRFSMHDAPGDLMFPQWLGILRFLQRNRREN